MAADIYLCGNQSTTSTDITLRGNTVCTATTGNGARPRRAPVFTQVPAPTSSVTTTTLRLHALAAPVEHAGTTTRHLRFTGHAEAIESALTTGRRLNVIASVQPIELRTDTAIRLRVTRTARPVDAIDDDPDQLITLLAMVSRRTRSAV